MRLPAHTAGVAAADLAGLIAHAILNSRSDSTPDVHSQQLAGKEDSKAAAALQSGEIKVIRDRTGYEDSLLTDEEFAAGVVTLQVLRSYVESRGGAVVEQPLLVADMRLWRLWDAIDELAFECGLPPGIRMAYRTRAYDDAKAGKLVVRDPLLGASCEAYTFPHMVDYTAAQDVNDWLEKELKVELRLRGIAAAGATRTGSSDLPPPLTRTRRDVLTPIIENARRRCKDPDDWSDVWAHLSRMAEEKEALLLGTTEDGIQYLDDGTAKIFTKAALRKRLGRSAGKKAAATASQQTAGS